MSSESAPCIDGNSRYLRKASKKKLVAATNSGMLTGSPEREKGGSNHSNELNHPDGARGVTAAEQDRLTPMPLALNVAACPTQAGGHSERFSVQF